MKKVKIVVLGDGSVGKTTLLMIYFLNYFPDAYVPTVFDATFESHDFFFEEERIGLSIFDTAGGEAFDIIRTKLVYPDTHCFLLCYSVTAPFSVTSLSSFWLKEVRESGHGYVPLVVCGTKADLKLKFPELYISPSKVRESLNSDIFIFETSALEEGLRTGKHEGNIDRVIQECVAKGMKCGKKPETTKKKQCIQL